MLALEAASNPGEDPKAGLSRPLARRGQQDRLADPGVPLDEQHPPLARVGCLESGVDGRQLVLALEQLGARYSDISPCRVPAPAHWRHLKTPQGVGQRLAQKTRRGA